MYMDWIPFPRKWNQNVEETSALSYLLQHSIAKDGSTKNAQQWTNGQGKSRINAQHNTIQS
jgi:hypothetical protein